MLQNEAFEREKLARVAAEAERRVAADEARRANAELQQAAAEQLQQALADASQRENQLRCAHTSQADIGVDAWTAFTNFYSLLLTLSDPFSTSQQQWADACMPLSSGKMCAV